MGKGSTVSQGGPNSVGKESTVPHNSVGKGSTVPHNSVGKGSRVNSIHISVGKVYHNTSVGKRSVWVKGRPG